MLRDRQPKMLAHPKIRGVTRSRVPKVGSILG